MRPSPQEALDPTMRSKQTLFEWFSDVSQVDLASDSYDELMGYFATRGPSWYRFLHEEWSKFHQEYSGFTIPSLASSARGRRPLIWNELGTAGSNQGMGGIDPRLALFGPLYYDGIVFTDAIAVPSELCRTQGRKELFDYHARDRFLEFIDVLIGYAPLFATGQMAVLSERTAFGAAIPPHPHDNPWESEYIKQDLMGRKMRGELSKDQDRAAAGIARLAGYLHLAEAHELDPIISNELSLQADLLFDYLAEIAFAGAPKNATAELIPPPKFQFSFFQEQAPKTRQEAAKLMSQLIYDDHWVRVREIFKEAINEATRDDYNRCLTEGMRELGAAERKQPPAFVSLATDFANNYAGSAVAVLSISAASFFGADWLADEVNSNTGANLLFSSAAATATGLASASLIQRVQRRSHVGPDVLSYALEAIGDPTNEQIARKAAAEAFIAKMRNRKSPDSDQA
ncbi:hypothetical protein [Meridianimarinicoccus roseus]|uniref:hypothetical protein n=1 Tax=Meridianimarinicoccus roseus TaxID=2072018 RepID=UPI0011B29B14|nr:hypothetical protein [Meridianimarinicoccus roseus]